MGSSHKPWGITVKRRVAKTEDFASDELATMLEGKTTVDAAS
jgi:hypothetical protein